MIRRESFTGALSALAFACLLVAANARAESASDVVATYLSVAGAGDYATAATYFDEYELEEFRDSVESVASSKRMLRQLFGDDADSVASLSDAKFFAVFLEQLLSDEELGLALDAFSVIGEVREDNGIVHVLTRHRFQIGTESFDTINVTQVMDTGSSPKIAMPPEIEALPAMIRDAYGISD